MFQIEMAESIPPVIKVFEFAKTAVDMWSVWTCSKRASGCITLRSIVQLLS